MAMSDRGWDPNIPSWRKGDGRDANPLPKSKRSLYALRMRLLFIMGGIVAVLIVAAATVAFVRNRQAFPAPSSEVIQLTAEKRAAIGRLRAEAKFGPHDFPPLGYTGVPTAQDRAVATAAVDGMLDAVLAKPDGPLEAEDVIDLISDAMRKVYWLETEDRERAGDYMVEAWYLLGFRGATGQFAPGAAYPRPPGYLEPLPPGWKSPTEPRPII